jgi:hypothetical protein
MPETSLEEGFRESKPAGRPGTPGLSVSSAGGNGGEEGQDEVPGGHSGDFVLEYQWNIK